MAELARRYLAECLAVAQAEGANLGGDIVDEIVDGFGRYPADMGTSFWPTGRPSDRWNGRSATA